MLLEEPLEKWVEKCIRSNPQSFVHIFPGRFSDTGDRKSLYSAFRGYLTLENRDVFIPPRKFFEKFILVL